MSSPRSSSSSPSSTPLTITSASLSSSMTNTPTPLATPLQTGLSASSSEPTVVAPETFDIDKIMDEFPQAELVDYHETQRGQVVSPSSSKALVLYKPKAPRLENLQERLEDVVRDLVLGAAKELNDLADAEINMEQKQEQASDSTKEEGELMIATPQQAPTHHESPKRTETVIFIFMNLFTVFIIP
uniref:uncharacterized protein LOC105349512 n=1 Tax=Fragaria vesca subsp. vesca TaxID=101020 RepID=UPI0005C7ECE6|nr:PREDICTED: uncharacterized protein LOC105349512 [Fragaria vesca subsp. vesca]